MNRASALALYESWNRRSADAEYRAPIQLYPALSRVGTCVEIIYWSNKWRKDRKWEGYYHMTVTSPLVWRGANRGTPIESFGYTDMINGRTRLSTALLGTVEAVVMIVNGREVTRDMGDALMFAVDGHTVLCQPADEKFVRDGIITGLTVTGPRFRVTEAGLVG